MGDGRRSFRQAGGSVQAHFPRTFAALEDVFAFTEAFFAQEKIGGEDRFAVDFAIEEIFTNMVKYNAGATHEIALGLSRSEHLVTVTLVDRGAARFDVTEVPDAKVDLPLEDRRVGGLGIHLTRRLMDGVDYAYADGTSTITMTRTLVERDV